MLRADTRFVKILQMEFPLRAFDVLESSDAESAAIDYIEDLDLLVYAKNESILIRSLSKLQVRGLLNPVSKTEILENEFDDSLDRTGFDSKSVDTILDISQGGSGHNFTIAAVKASGIVYVWRIEVPADYSGFLDSLEIHGPITWRVQSKNLPKFISIHPTSGSYAAVGHLDGRIRVFDASDGTCVHHFINMFEAGDTLTTMKFHPRRLILFAGSAQGVFCCLDLVRSTILSRTAGHKSAICDAAFLDAQVGTLVPLVVTASRDKWLHLWSLEGPANAIAMAVGASSVSLGEEQSLEELSFGSAKRRKYEHSKPLATKSAASTILNEPHQLQRQAQIRVKSEPESIAIINAKAAPNFATTECTWFTLTGDALGQLHLWDMLNSRQLASTAPSKKGHNNIQELGAFRCPRPGIRKLFRSKDGLRILVQGLDKSITQWSTNSLEPTTSHKTSFGVIDATCIFIEPLIPKTNAQDHSTKKIDQQNLDLENAEEIDPQNKPSDEEIPAAVVAEDRQITLLLSGPRFPLQFARLKVCGTKGVVPMTVQEWQHPLVAGEHVINCVSMSADGVWMAMSLADGPVLVVEMATGSLRAEIPLDVNGYCVALAFGGGSPPALYTGSKDGYLRLWRLKSKYRKLRTPDRSVSVSVKSIRTLAVSPNNKLVITGSNDRSLKVWGTGNLEAKGVCRGNTGVVACVAFSPVEQAFATGSLDGTVRVWNARSFAAVMTMSRTEACVSSLVYHPDGQHLVYGGVDGRLNVWDVKTGVSLGSMRRHGCAIQAMKFVEQQSAHRLVTVGEDGGVFFWIDETHARREVTVAEERRKKEDLAALKDLVIRKEFGKAMSLALKWRRLDLFEVVVNRVQEASVSGTLTSDTGLIDTSDPVIVEQCLMGALYFSKKPRQTGLAQWLVAILLRDVG